MEAEPKWGILYFTYDWFSAIRTDLVCEVKYDTFITVYMSDCDFYPRVRAAGWGTLQYSDHCPGISPRVSHCLQRPPCMPGMAVLSCAVTGTCMRPPKDNCEEACCVCTLRPFLAGAGEGSLLFGRPRACGECPACDA